MGQIKANFPLGISSGIAVYDDVLDEEFLNSLICHLSEDFDNLFEQGPTIGGLNTLMKMCMDTEMLNPNKYSSDRVKDLNFYVYANHVVSTAMWSCVLDYIQSYNHLWQAPNVGLTGVRIQRYFRNHGYYREHCDGLPWDSVGSNEPTRILASVAYLNTVSDGGGTMFPLHEYTSEAVAGRVVIFPTTWQYPHLGTVPYSSDKWIVSSFVTSTTIPYLPEQYNQEVQPTDNSVFIYPDNKNED